MSQLNAGKANQKQLRTTRGSRAEHVPRSREGYLALLNEMTHAILLSNNFDTTLGVLARDMARLIDADNCYITRWDDEKQRTLPIAKSAAPDKPYSSIQTAPTETSLTSSIMKAGHVLVVDDVLNTPNVNHSIEGQFPARSILGVPLIVGEHKLGAAIIAFDRLHQFTAEEMEWAEQAGNQVALALWNFEQSNEIKRRLRESNALTEIGRALSKTEHTGTDRVLQLIVDSARELIEQAEESVIHLLEADERTLMARAVSGQLIHVKEFTRVQMRAGEGVAGQVIREGVTINIANVETDPRFLQSDSQPKFRSLLVAPVQSGGRQIGTISVQSHVANAFSGRDVELLNSLGIQAAIAIENTHLFEVTQQRLKEVDSLYKLSRGLAASLNPDELIKDIVVLLQQNFGYYHVQIYLLDVEQDLLALKNASGDLGRRLLDQSHTLPRGTGIIGQVMETGAPFVTNDVDNVIFFDRNPLLPDTQSELTVPIRVEGRVVGVLDIQDKPPHRLTDGDLQLMTAVADQLAVALDKANLYTNLQTSLEQEQTIRSQLVQSERLALVGRLLASVSHELNNPLQAIQNALFLIKEESSLSPQGRQDLDIVLSETERMAALIERLRSAYRPIRFTDFHPVQLNNLIEDVYALINTHLRHKNITFEFLPEENLPPVSGIGDQLRQVVLNLFLNAVEVMQPGGLLRVRTSEIPERREILFSVSDSGPGIEPDLLPRIFDPFITSKHTGTGLGLTITHDIIDQHHGRIEARNNPEGGAVFDVWLPMDASS